MVFHFYFCQPPSQALSECAANLYARRGEGVVVERQRIVIDGWHPVVNQCHDNAMRLVEKDPNYSAVHGWLYFDLGGRADFVRFAAHSVVERPDGLLIDITPTDAQVVLYPFIRSNPHHARNSRLQTLFFALPCEINPPRN